ncbi:RND family efflux transporter MFP subunit [Rhodobacter sp. JA431]|uniref:efflux RND transporter periplasmic adaptor subunit n=1 Tax=Rhodobacter sp. JA431 TaxID=570013 RepID=UPI000BDB710A|nr:efflux RND transporter periplasmic adaptor subunit [Rhodobacter sp. JA431]SOB89512.1 RND family efflux transporter MFP subunit [Rhodobacter sp. JA431]
MSCWRSRVRTSVLLAFLASPLAAQEGESGYCLLAPIKDTNLSFSGRELVKEVVVQLGQEVHAGDIVMRLDGAGMPARYERSLAELRQAERAMERAEMLGRVMIAEERDRRETDLAVKAASAREMELELERLNLRAPHDGIVVSIAVQEGEMLEDSAAMRIVDLSQLLVEIDVPSDRFGQFDAGQEVKIRTESGAIVAATVVFADPIIDLASKSFRVNAVLENADREFVAGTSCMLVSTAK